MCSAVGLQNVAEFRPTVCNFHISSRLDVSTHRMLFGGPFAKMIKDVSEGKNQSKLLSTP